MLFGGSLGWLIGSLEMNADSIGNFAPGALAGAGVIITTGVLMNSQWTAVEKIGVAAIAGGMIGAGVGLREDGKLAAGTPEKLAAESKVASYAGVGLAAGAALGGFTAVATGLKHVPAFGWLLRPSRPVRVINRGRHMGLGIRW